jgi:Na+/H+ antiporter NhaA
MARRNPNTSSLIRRLRPSPARFAAAAAVHDPSLLVRLPAERSDGASPASPRRRRTASATREAVAGEAGGALLLGAAVALALVWSNSPWGTSYASFWHAPVALTVGPWTLGADLRTWVDEGLMTLFFLVVGLEAKRERDLGELRERSRLSVPLVAGLTGMIVPAAVYLAVTAGAGAGGWRVAISTDTALALGVLTLASGRSGDRTRAFMLTMRVDDDVAALLVISFVYPSPIDASALVVAAGLLALLLAMRAIAARQFRARRDSAAALTPVSVLTGVALWLALFESGIDPVVSGLLIALLTVAYQPDPDRLAPAAQISPDGRLQHRLHRLTSKVVVPVFALANAGLHIDRHPIAAAATSPITWGIVLAYTVGKPLGIVTAAFAASRGAGQRAVLSLSPVELRGTPLSAGVGFTVSLLIASHAFHGAQLEQAKLGILVTALVAAPPAVVALAPLRRRDGAARVRRGCQLAVATPCPTR